MAQPPRWMASVLSAHISFMVMKIAHMKWLVVVAKSAIGGVLQLNI
jgi:hypothetical protein